MLRVAKLFGHLQASWVVRIRSIQTCIAKILLDPNLLSYICICIYIYIYISTFTSTSISIYLYICIYGYFAFKIYFKFISILKPLSLLDNRQSSQGTYTWPGNTWWKNRDGPQVNIFCTLSASKVFWPLFALNNLLKTQNFATCWNRGRYHSFRTIAITRSSTNIMQHRPVFIGPWQNSLATFSQRYKLTERAKRVTL